MIILSLYQGTRVEGDIVLDLSRLNGSPLTRKLILSGLIRGIENITWPRGDMKFLFKC